MDSQHYQDGWIFARECWNDLEPYDPKFHANHLEDSAAEVYQEGYEDFWKSKSYAL